MPTMQKKNSFGSAEKLHNCIFQRKHPKLYAFFWVIPRRLNFIFRRFETLSVPRGELSYLAPLGSENISAPYFKQCFFQGGGITTQTGSKTTPPSPKTEITNILFYILNFASIIKFKM